MRATSRPADGESDKGEPGEADESSELGEQRDVRADQRADLGDSVQQERRSDCTGIPEPHAVRVRDEEPKPCAPDSRTVQDRAVQRQAGPQPPKRNRARDGEGRDDGLPKGDNRLVAPHNPRQRRDLQR